MTWFKQAKWFSKNGWLIKTESGTNLIGKFQRLVAVRGKKKETLNFFYSHSNTKTHFGTIDWVPRVNWIEKL